MAYQEVFVLLEKRKFRSSCFWHYGIYENDVCQTLDSAETQDEVRTRLRDFTWMDHHVGPVSSLVFFVYIEKIKTYGWYYEVFVNDELQGFGTAAKVEDICNFLHRQRASLAGAGLNHSNAYARRGVGFIDLAESKKARRGSRETITELQWRDEVLEVKKERKEQDPVDDEVEKGEEKQQHWEKQGRNRVHLDQKPEGEVLREGGKHEQSRELQGEQEKKRNREREWKEIETRDGGKTTGLGENDGEENLRDPTGDKKLKEDKKQREGMVEGPSEEGKKTEEWTKEKEQQQTREKMSELKKVQERLNQERREKSRSKQKEEKTGVEDDSETKQQQQQPLLRSVRTEAGHAGQYARHRADSKAAAQTVGSDAFAHSQGRSRFFCSASGSLEKHWTTNVVSRLFAILVIGQLPLASAATVSLHVEGRGLAVQGRPYAMACVPTHAQASDTASVFTWYRDGHVLNNQTGRVLAFTTVSKRDEGDYQCLQNQEGVPISGPFTLHVIVFEKLSMVSEVEVEEGQTVILNCSVHSDPTAFLNWRVDGELVLTVRSNSYGLVLHNASSLHLSIVECQAYNNALQLGFMSTYTLIRIKGTYEIIPRPWLGPRGTPVVHRPFGMECLVMDIPNHGVNVHLTYTWYKDDKVIEGQSDMILDIPSVTREDSGLYTCTARNGRPRTTSLESNALEVVVLVPPVVQIEPRTPDQSVLGAAGHNLTLTCKVTEAFPGVAPDGYRWSYLPSPQAQLRPLEGRESTLTLGPLTREDRGQYFCQAWNYEDFDGLLPPGNASITVDIMYLGNISLTPDLEVNEGDHVILTCEVDCNPPARLAWIFGGVEVRHVTANVDHYVIPRAACSDSQTYVCCASHPDLPGLETHASTHVLVNCSSPGEDIVTTKFTAHTTEPVPAGWNTTALAIALPSVVIALAVIIVVVVVVCIVRKRRERCCETEADKKDEEKEPMNV